MHHSTTNGSYRQIPSYTKASKWLRYNSRYRGDNLRAIAKWKPIWHVCHISKDVHVAISSRFHTYSI
jgi:hypothetical protein